MRLRTPDKFRFPAFETFQWYAAKFYAQKVKELNAASKCVHPNLLSGLKYLKETLKRWINSKNVNLAKYTKQFLIYFVQFEYPDKKFYNNKSYQF